jgi:hypothetical protein
MSRPGSFNVNAGRGYASLSGDGRVSRHMADIVPAPLPMGEVSNTLTLFNITKVRHNFKIFFFFFFFFFFFLRIAVFSFRLLFH